VHAKENVFFSSLIFNCELPSAATYRAVTEELRKLTGKPDLLPVRIRVQTGGSGRQDKKQLVWPWSGMNPPHWMQEGKARLDWQKSRVAKAAAKRKIKKHAQKKPELNEQCRQRRQRGEKTLVHKE
jgi:hypothetical protein